MEQTVSPSEGGVAIAEPESSDTVGQAPVQTAPIHQSENGPRLVKKKKKRKKAPLIIGGSVFLVLVILIWWAIAKTGEAPEGQVMDETIQRGSITSVIKGSGMTTAKSSEAITVGTSGTVVDVFVTEGQFVTAGTQLYIIDSPAAEDAVKNAQQDVDGYQKQLKLLNEARQNLTVRAEFTGKLLEVSDEVKVGETISSGTGLTRLVDDSKMKLTQYYSYAYEGSVKVGQTAQISVPGVMQQLSGTVIEILKTERISPEGSRLFRVDFTVPNPGTLTEGLEASAVLTTGGETISPYELGKLEYNRSMEVKAKVSGEVLTNNMYDYKKVSAGDTLLRIDGEDTESEAFTLQDNLRQAQKKLEEAQKNLNNLRATAPIDGTVVGLAITPGQEVAASTAVISIVDATVILVEAGVDERNIQYLTVGMQVDLNQWGNQTVGIVEKVGLNGKFENGMTTFPVTITVDNAAGMLMSGSSIEYSVNASQSDDCLMVPKQCVKSIADPETGESISVVFVKADTRPENAIEADGTSLGVPEEGYFAVPVVTGISDTSNVELLEGPEEGTAVFAQKMVQSPMY